MSQSSMAPRTAPSALHFRLPLEPSHLLRARERLRDYLQLHCADAALVDDVVLCLEEACTNAIRYSGAGDGMQVALRFDGDDLICQVSDHGRGFDIDAFDPQIVPDPLGDGGRGLFIIAHIMDEMELRHDGGLEVRMVKRALPRCAAPGLEAVLGEADGASGSDARQTRLRALLEEINEGFLALDWEYRYLHVNEAMLRLTGKSREELLGRTPFEVWPQLAGTELEERYREAMELGQSSVFEQLSPVNRDWLETRVYPTPSGISVYFREINERKHVEQERERLFEELRGSKDKERFLADVLERADVPFGVGAPDERLVLFNQAFADLTGYSRQELEERQSTWSVDLAPPEWREAESKSLAEAVSERRAVRYEKEYLRKDGSRVPIEVLAQPFFDDAGQLLHFRSFLTDITERKQAEEERERLLEESQLQAEELQGQSEELQARTEELRVQAEDLARRAELAEALNAINRRLHSTLDADVITQRALEEGVRALAVDAGGIELRKEDMWIVAYQHGFSKEEIGMRLSELEAPNATRAAQRREPFAIADMASAPSLEVGFAHAHGLRSVLAVPLLAREAVVGCLLFYGKNARVFGDSEIDFGRKLGATVSLALENARLYAAQQRIATTLQENFIHPPPEVAGLEFGIVSQTAYEPELIGGDFSEVFEVAGGRIAVLIGDVAGKGVKAAGLTETVRSMVRAFAAIEPSPAFILARTNEVLLRYDSAEPHVTAFLVVLDPQTGHALYASAGHPAPVHMSPSFCRPLEVAFGPPLLSFPSKYQEEHSRLSLEDYLLLYTDGVTEARRGAEWFGEERLVDLAYRLSGRSAQEVAEGVRAAALEFAGSLKDDLHVVCLRLA